MSQSLAVKYRPKKWDDVVGQDTITKVLARQKTTGCLRNCYLFCGPSGCGKTTVARIFADVINDGQGSPIEVDAASNNGVDNVRDIIIEAQKRALDSTYRIYILDECHMLSGAAWNAMLKIIEEPPQYTIFIFCTTDVQKIPQTILNRVQRFDFAKIGSADILSYLNYICRCEGLVNYTDTLDYISKICNGGMRDAIALLDKCASYTSDLTLNNVANILGNYSYNRFFNLTNYLLDGNAGDLLQLLQSMYDEGIDFKVFISKYLSFIIDILKYIIFKSLDITHIPASLETSVQNIINFENPESYYNYVMDKVLELKNSLKTEENVELVTEAWLLQIARGV